ncbi:MAG: putative DNA-binding domain-containing protein [Polaromonas sp.]
MPNDAQAALALAQQQLVSLLVSGRKPNVGASPGLLAQGGPAREALNQRGWQVYHANTAALAERALGAAYPVLAQLLGTENFTPLSRLFWRAHPPHCGDMAQWGAALPAWLQHLPQLADQPFLADVARVEWVLHHLASAPDAEVDAASFQRLVSDDPDTLTLQLAPGTVCVASTWPVVSLVQAHDPLAAVTLAQAWNLLQQHTAETALLWRQGFKPQLRAALAGECAFVADLQAAQSLGHALARHSALDFNAWLPLAVTTGLLLGVSDIRQDVLSP